MTISTKKPRLVHVCKTDKWRTRLRDWWCRRFHVERWSLIYMSGTDYDPFAIQCGSCSRMHGVGKNQPTAVRGVCSVCRKPTPVTICRKCLDKGAR